MANGDGNSAAVVKDPQPAAVEKYQKLSKELPAISMPKRYFVFEELPKMGSGKIDFRTTTEMVKSALQKEKEEAEANKLAKKKPPGNTTEDNHSSNTETPDEG